MSDNTVEQQIRQSLEKIANDPEAKQELTNSDWFNFSQTYLLLGVIDRLDQVNKHMENITKEVSLGACTFYDNGPCNYDC